MNWSTDPFPSVDELNVSAATTGARQVAPVSMAERNAVLDDARREGFERGVIEGRNAGRHEAIEAARPDVSFALTALTEAIEDLHRRDSIVAAQIAAQTVDLALAIAESVIGRELQISASTGREALVRAMAVAPDRGDVVARLHPIDVATLRDADRIVDGRSVEIIADQSVERGGAILSVGSSTINAQLDQALERVRDELHKIDVIAATDDNGRAELTVFEGGRS